MAPGAAHETDAAQAAAAAVGGGVPVQVSAATGVGLACDSDLELEKALKGLEEQEGPDEPGQRLEPAEQDALTPNELIDEHVFGPRVHEEVGDLRRRLANSEARLKTNPNEALEAKVARMRARLRTLEGPGLDPGARGADVPGVGRINTRAAIQVIGPNGKIIALQRGSWGPNLHAEQDAMAKLRIQLGEQTLPEGTRIMVAGNQVVCNAICKPDIARFAKDYGVSLKNVSASVRTRPKIVGQGLASGKTTERTGLRGDVPKATVKTESLFPSGKEPPAQPALPKAPETPTAPEAAAATTAPEAAATSGPARAVTTAPEAMTTAPEAMTTAPEAATTAPPEAATTTAEVAPASRAVTTAPEAATTAPEPTGGAGVVAGLAGGVGEMLFNFIASKFGGDILAEQIDWEIKRDLNSKKMQKDIHTAVNQRGKEIKKLVQQTKGRQTIYANVHLDIQYTESLQADQPWTNYDGTSLIGVDVSTRDISSRKERREKGLISRVVHDLFTFSLPVWDPEIVLYRAFAGREPKLPSFYKPLEPELSEVLRFSNTGEVVTRDRLVAWAHEFYPGASDNSRILERCLKNIYYSNEFAGSQDARKVAAVELTLRLREEKKLKAHTAE
jgi:hypothetical protein